MEAIVYPKRPSSRRDTSYPRAPAEYSDRCRKQRYLRHRCRKYLTYDTAARSPYTPRITPRLPRLRWHVVGQSLKLWCIPNGPVLDEIRRILVNPQNNQTGVVNKPKIGLIYDTAARSRHTPRIGQTLPRLFWHGVELSLKLSCTENGPVFDEMHRIRVHPQNNQTGVVNKPHLRHRSKLAVQLPDRPSVTTAVCTWWTAIVDKAIVCPKRPSTRRDTYVVSAYTNTKFKLALVLVCTVAHTRALVYRYTIYTKPPPRHE